MMIGDRIAARMAELGISQAALARKIGVSQQAIGKLVKGHAQASRHLHLIARELGTTPQYLTGETDDPSEGALPALTPELLSEQLGLVEIKEIDLAYGMGASYLDMPVTTESRHFSLAWVRTYTNSSPDKLFFARGIGDSMAPTLLDSDIVLIDTAQQTPRMSDQIWAIAYGQVGMIKRLRPMPDGSVKILSDNDRVPPEIAVDGEMHVIGRVVAVIRKL
jgi:Predicted transcriptional regulator